MTLAGRDVLLVGENFQGARTLTAHLHRWDFRSQFATSVRSANKYLACEPIDLVLSNTHLLDGTGYRLLMNLARLPVSGFLCFPVEKSCLWLLAIDGGKRCLGLPALRPLEFARALEDMAQRLST